MLKLANLQSIKGTLVMYGLHNIKRWSEAESFTIFENHVYGSKKNLMFAQKFEATLAPKLTQHVLAIGSIKYYI